MDKSVIKIKTKTEPKKSYHNLIGFILILLLCCSRRQDNQVFNTVEVDKENRFIIFTAKVNFSVEKKYFLFYFKGYPWMEDHSIFVSSTTLAELQKAVALIDWQLWDDIYVNRKPPKLKIQILINNRWQELNEFIQMLNFDNSQVTFWGDPVYDEIVLKQNYQNNLCYTCPTFALEKEIFLSKKKVINYKFLKPFDDVNVKFKIIFIK